MRSIINISEIITAVLLMIAILLQNRGAGLSGTFGGDFGGYYTRRGFEKFLVVGSVILSGLFIVFSVVNLFLAQ